MNEDALDTLSIRERQVLNSFLLGQGRKEIATKYGIAECTVGAIKTRMIGKMGVKDYDALLELAREQKWIEDIPAPDVPVVYQTIEDAAGPQARFIVGTEGDGYYRFERRICKKKLGVITQKILDMEYVTGYKGVRYERLSVYRRVYHNAYLASLDKDLACNKHIEVCPYRDGFLLAMYGGQINASTLRLSREFVREGAYYVPINPAFSYLLERNYLMAATTSGHNFAPKTMVNLTTTLSLTNDQWYSIGNSGIVPIHYKQVETTDPDPTYGSTAANFRSTLYPHDKSDNYLQESGLELWVWCDDGSGFITVNEAE